MRQGGDLELEVDAIEQRPGEAAQVARPFMGRAGAAGQGGAASAAGVGGGDKLEAGGEGRGPRGAGDDDAGVLEKLAEGFEDARGELGPFVMAGLSVSSSGSPSAATPGPARRLSTALHREGSADGQPAADLMGTTEPNLTRRALPTRS
jgi:hypothetical protein